MSCCCKTHCCDCNRCLGCGKCRVCGAQRWNWSGIPYAGTGYTISSEGTASNITVDPTSKPTCSHG